MNEMREVRPTQKLWRSDRDLKTVSLNIPEDWVMFHEGLRGRPVLSVKLTIDDGKMICEPLFSDATDPMILSAAVTKVGKNYHKFAIPRKAVRYFEEKRGKKMRHVKIRTNKIDNSLICEPI